MKGEIITIRFPYTDLSSSKPRPSLVIADNGIDIVTVFISSVIHKAQSHDILIRTSHPEYERTGLDRTSFVKIDKIMTVDKSEPGIVQGVIGEFGPILKSEFNKVFAPFYEL